MGGLVLLAVGCFAPDGASGIEETETDSQTSGPTTTGPTTTGPTGSSEPTGSPTSPSEPRSSDTTDGDTSATEPTGTAGDAPPQIASFTVNGSDAPREVSAGSRAQLAAVVTDDMGIAAVDFYDGATLLARVETEPYETSVLITSADNGAHTYRAVAYDMLDQNDEAAVDLNVSIVGGSILELRDDILDVQLEFGSGGPQLTLDSESRVHLLTTERYESAGIIRARLGYLRYDGDLNLADSGAYPVTINSGSPYHRLDGGGVLTDDESNLVVSASRDIDEMIMLVFDTTTGTGTLQFAEGANGAQGGMARDAAGNSYAAMTEDAVNGVADDFGSLLWTASLNQTWNLAGGSDFVIVDSVDLSSSVDDLFLHKVSSDGTVEWTRNVHSTGSLVEDCMPGVSAVTPGGEVVTVFGGTATPLQAQVRGEDGSTIDEVSLAGNISPFSIAIDAQQMLVVVGFAGNEFWGDAWVGRYTLDGTEIWSSTLDVPGLAGSVTSVAGGPDGATYIAGFRDPVSDGAFLERAPAWVARIEL